MLTVNRDLDHHWFDNTGCQYPLVCPKGTKVKFKSILHNYYGIWMEVEYEGRLHYGFLKDFDGNVILKHMPYDYFDPAMCQYRRMHRIVDREGNMYMVKEPSCDLEFIRKVNVDKMIYEGEI